ncbi:PREDICTED: probable serine racemase isoform X2 [Amphimedon queenslandica]|uniref:Tryptophan synthase beta chain-like PALP domain-containing protein n=1 Tax=Amphimedon queenslandica TaxID=400682 RepID=A0AAN0J0L2_AMPQE|nr:PREDICTED: probable serine racemase isoform X2 [Amphimedon queenslandica]|eukprot:XP_019850256.1 PREDICTED: probable serine racemase isoform X2 [Amphimedon queenslandica]
MMMYFKRVVLKLFTRRMSSVTLKDVRDARERIKDSIHYTPVLTSTYLNTLSGHSLYFKCENMQKTGSFKVRGALNAVRSLTVPDPVIVTHSSGNHAQAVALAAKLSGYKAHVVMPENSLDVKKNAVLGLGAQVSYCTDKEKSRQEVADQVLASLSGKGVFISPVNHHDVIAGQGTIAIELLEQVPDLDVIVVSVGGGGMISGIAIAAKGINPNIKVIGAEPAAADDCANSLEAGRLIPNQDESPQTICDGLLVSITELPWSIIRKSVDGVIRVTDEETIAAMRLVFERLKVVIEPSAACPLAAVCTEKFKELFGMDKSLKIGIVLCGGNVNLLTLSNLMSRVATTDK